jgi:glycosyltransferase involved in cell wall biosynthesis
VRIGLVTPRFLPEIGGLEVHVGHLSRQLADLGHHVEVLTQATRKAPRVAMEAGCTVRRFPVVLGGQTYPFAPGLWRYLLRHAGDYDVIHMHSYHATSAIPAALARPRRVIFTPHYLGGGRSTVAQIMHRPYRPIGRFLFQRSDDIVCTTTAEAAMLARDFPRSSRKTRVIPNGIDSAAIASAEVYPYPGPVILYAGRLDAYKNVHLVVESLRCLDEEMRLVVVGAGPAAGDLANLADDLGVSSRVQFIGPVPPPEVYRWLRTADVFVTMSARESFGMSVLEAYVAGVGLVISDIAPHREVLGLVDGDAELVPVGADARDVASAVRRAMAHRPASGHPGARALPPAHRGRVPSWSDHVDELVRLYSGSADEG